MSEMQFENSLASAIRLNKQCNGLEKWLVFGLHRGGLLRWLGHMRRDRNAITRRVLGLPFLTVVAAQPTGWTTDRPTKVGWYWFKGAYRTNTKRGYETVEQEKQVVQVFDYCGDLMSTVSNGTAEKLEHLTGVWHGPIPDPDTTLAE